MLAELNDVGNELNIVVLDACRDFPAAWMRSTNCGLTVVSNQPADSIIVYATSAGSTAADGTGRNGLFTEQLLKQLKTPGLDVKEIFDNTGAAVSQSSSRNQIPAIYSQYFGKAYLGPRPSPQPSPTPAVRPTPQPSPQPVSNNMVRVEGGTFQMGSNSGENNEKPVHAVTVKSFNMGKYEVTQKEWFDVMGTTIRQQQAAAGNSNLYGVGDNYRMYYVSWLEAVEYCNKRSQREGLTPAYGGSGNNITCDWNANGYRLPTEAEWEYAAKGGNRDAMVYEYSGGNSVGAVAWYYGNSESRMHPVGTKAPNSLGLYDMSGNVREWCWDWYGNYASGTQTDPRGLAA
jgi:formylglycine-generating enzyme required for sulfatase activity